MSRAKNMSKDRHVEIGNRLRVARQNAGVTQETLAKSLGLTFQQVQKYEKGANRIDPVRLMKCAEILNSDMSFLLGLDHKNDDKSKVFNKLIASRAGMELFTVALTLTEPQVKFVTSFARSLPQFAEGKN